MVCEKCGNNIPDGAEKCTSCGASDFGKNEKSIGAPAPEVTANTAVGGGNRKKIMIISAMCAILLIGGIGGCSAYQYYNSPRQVMNRSIDSGNYDEAYELYAENFENEDMPDKLFSAFSERLDMARQQFTAREKDYSETLLEINRIKDMDIAELDDKADTFIEYINTLNTSRTAFALGTEYLDKTDYVAAMVQFKLVIEEDGDYSTAQENLKKSVELYRKEQLDKAASSADSGDYDSAITVINGALKTLENDQELTQRLEIYKSMKISDDVNSILESAKSYADNSDYVQAITVLKKAMITYPDETDIKTKYDDYETIYVKTIISDADKLAGERDYDPAIKMVDSAMKILPDNKTLSDKYDFLVASKPVELKNIKMQNANNFSYIESACEDVVGNVYSGNNIYLTNQNNYGSDGSCEFYMGGEYQSISGTVAPQSKFGQNNATNFEIYADGELKYSAKITQKTLAFSFEADISGAEWIEIKTSKIVGISRYYTPTIIYNPVLFK